MSKRTFQNLDDDARALHDSWDHIARLVLVSTLVVVWGACTGLRLLVQAAAHPVVGAVQADARWGSLILVAALVVSGGVRGLLLRRPEWLDAAGDGMEVALENYHVTYATTATTPSPGSTGRRSRSRPARR